MKLSVTCISCREQTRIPYDEISRPYLADKIGEVFKHRCTECGSIGSYHVNRVTAKESNMLNIGGTILGLLILVGVTIGFWIYGYITRMGLLLGGGIVGASQISSRTSNAGAFNSYFL